MSKQHCMIVIVGYIESLDLGSQATLLKNGPNISNRPISHNNNT